MKVPKFYSSSPIHASDWKVYSLAQVASQLENLGRQILHDCGQIDRRSGINSLRVVAFAQQTMNATDRELETRGPIYKISYDLAYDIVGLS